MPSRPKKSSSFSSSLSQMISTEALQSFAACTFGVLCSHACDVASTRIVLFDVKDQYQSKTSLIPHMMQRVVMMFTMMELYDSLSHNGKFTSWQAGALSGYASGLVASPMELYKVHRQSACDMPFATRLRSNLPYTFMMIQMASCRNMVFDGVFFNFASHPKKR